MNSDHAINIIQELETEMTKEFGGLFTTDQFVEFVEKKYGVSVFIIFIRLLYTSIISGLKININKVFHDTFK